jgi:hypothetical protein
MGLPLKKPTATPYPQKEIRQTIREWWEREQEDLEKIADPPDQLKPESGTVFDLVPVISSHHAVEVVLDLEDILGYEIPDTVIKRGGYQTCEEMIEDLDRKLSTHHAKTSD